MSKSKKLKFQLLSEEEIKYATSSAQIALAKQTQAHQQKYPSCVFDFPEREERRPIDLGCGESAMRSKQIIKRVEQIRDELTHLKRIAKAQKESVFIPPLVLETMNKRWGEYLCSARRSLFNLRREVSQLNSIISSRSPNEDKFMRKLSLSVRSTLLLLQGLTKYSDKIHPGGEGRALYFEILETSKNILKLAASIGIAKSPLKPKEQTDTSITESSLDNPSRSLILESSDINSEVLNVVAPENVRRNLAYIVAGNGRDKSKKKPSNNMSPQKPKNALSHESPFEDLPDGRRIQLVQDSLTPILQQKATLSAQAKSVRFQPSKVISMENRPYGNAEKMADEVFEQLLPHIKESRIKTKEAPLQENFAIHITDLLKRLTVLEQKRKKHSQYLSDISHSSATPEKKASDLENAIGAANQSLFEASRLGLTSPPEELTDIQPPPTLAVVKQQQQEFWESLVNNNYLPKVDPCSEDQSNSQPVSPSSNNPATYSRNNAGPQIVHPGIPTRTNNLESQSTHNNPREFQQLGPTLSKKLPTTSDRFDQNTDTSGARSGREQVPSALSEEQNDADQVPTSERNTENGREGNTIDSGSILEEVDGSCTYQSTSGNSEALESSAQFFDS